MRRVLNWAMLIVGLIIFYTGASVIVGMGYER